MVMHVNRLQAEQILAKEGRYTYCVSFFFQFIPECLSVRACVTSMHVWACVCVHICGHVGVLA